MTVMVMLGAPRFLLLSTSSLATEQPDKPWPMMTTCLGEVVIVPLELCGAFFRAGRYVGTEFSWELGVDVEVKAVGGQLGWWRRWWWQGRGGRGERVVGAALR